MFNAYENTATMVQALAAIECAKAHLLTTKCSMWSSAAACVGDAITLIERGPGFGHEWALQSLAYSVGIFHPDYIRIQAESRKPKAA